MAMVEFESARPVLTSPMPEESLGFRTCYDSRRIMQASDGQQRSRYAFLIVIFVAVLIDAVLFAFIHARYVSDHGIDVRPRHPAVAKPAPP